MLVTVGVGGTATEEGIKRPLGRSREAGLDVDLWRGGRVEHDTANIRREEAHHGEGQPGAVGYGRVRWSGEIGVTGAWNATRAEG